MEVAISRVLCKSWPWPYCVWGSQEPSDVHPLTHSVCQNLYSAIYGSNYIEGVGSSLVHTAIICEDIFSRQPVLAEDITPGEYYELGAHRDRYPHEHQVVAGRREVIQHAKAYDRLVTVLVVKGKPLTEELLEETYADLVTDSPWSASAGMYRTGYVITRYSPNYQRTWRPVLALGIPVYGSHGLRLQR